MIVPDSTFLDQSLTSRLVETVSFNDHNFVESYDKKIFSIKKTFDLIMYGVYCSLKLKQTSDYTLRDYSIVIIKYNGKKIKLLVENNKLFKLINKVMSCKIEKGDFFLKLQKTTQKEGQKVYDMIHLINEYVKNMKNKKRELIKNQEIMEEACLKADELAQTFIVQIWDLENEMAQCGLQPEDIILIKDNSAGLYDITHFLQEIAPTLPKETTIIGLNHKSIIDGVNGTLKCDDYMDVYFRIFNDFRARPDFLEKLTAEANPIIFLIPHKLLGPKQGVTAKEMQWLLKNPKQMTNVHFILRSYKVYSKKIIPSTGTEQQIECYTECLTKRIFKQIQNNGTLPEKNYGIKILKQQLLLDRYQTIKIQPFKKPVKHLSCMINTPPVIRSLPSPSKVPLIACCYSFQALPSIECCHSFDIKKAIFFIGGAGAGKGTVRDSILQRHPERNYIIIDPDLIKTTIPGYQNAIMKGDVNAANDFHQESVTRSTELLTSMIQIGVNFIYDSTGSRSWIYEEQMAAAKDKGMFVELIYVATQVDICIKRAEQRALKEGRFVPTKTIQSTNECAELNFDDFKKWARQWKKYNNDGSKPHLVDSSKNKRESPSKK